jgi:pheromone a factor receptor
MYSEIPVLSFISAALSLVPLIWYLHARNIAAVAIGIWLSITNLTYAVDALLWAKDADIEASVWCDICKFISTLTAIPCADFGTLGTLRSNEFYYWFAYCAARSVPLHLYTS